MRIWLILAFVMTACTASAQGTGVALGGFGYDKSLPVEITADSLDVNQTDGSATFTGNVVIGQGDMRLSAGRVVVEYGADAEGRSEIKKLLASGGVTLVSANEAAEAESAVYSVTTGSIVLSGSVLVTQGPATISGDTLTVDLASGNGSVEGNVRTLLQTGSDQ